VAVGWVDHSGLMEIDGDGRQLMADGCRCCRSGLTFHHLRNYPVN
jgi:hypothetical protein